MFTSLCTPLDARGQIRGWGGWSQRVGQVDAAQQAAPAVVRPSASALGHLQDWGNGVCSAWKIVEHMHRSVHDGDGRHPMVRRIAALRCTDTSGVSGSLVSLLETCNVDVPIQAVDGGVVTHIAAPDRPVSFLSQNVSRKIRFAFRHRRGGNWATSGTG